MGADRWVLGTRQPVGTSVAVNQPPTSCEGQVKPPVTATPPAGNVHIPGHLQPDRDETPTASPLQQRVRDVTDRI